MCTFSGINILNSTVSGAGTVVFADGATVTSTIPSGSTIGTGVIAAQFGTPISYLGNMDNVEFNGITVSNWVFDDQGIGPKANKTVKFTDCLITGWTFNSYTPGLNTYGENSRIELNRVSFTANVKFNYVYASAAGSVVLWKDTTVNNTGVSVGVNNGTLIFEGVSKCYNLYGADERPGNYVFTPGSTTTIANAVPEDGWPANGHRNFYVGTVADDGTITTTGEATVILQNTTISISGYGTKLDNTGLHT
jgi:hypothetical protein